MVSDKKNHRAFNKQNPLEKFFILTIYQNYTLALSGPWIPVLREIYDLRNLLPLGYLRMRQVFRRQVFRKG